MTQRSRHQAKRKLLSGRLREDTVLGPDWRLVFAYSARSLGMRSDIDRTYPALVPAMTDGDGEVKETVIMATEVLPVGVDEP